MMLANRGPEASTSGREQITDGWQKMCVPTASLRLTRKRLKRQTALQAKAQTTSSDKVEDWETYWVHDNGTAAAVSESFADDPEEAPIEQEKVQEVKKRLPAEMRCFDTATIFLQAGNGGNGCVAFRREKFIPRGGPAGGNGGQGGHVWAVVEEGLNSLSTFRRQLHFRAKSGVSGVGSDMHGAGGADIEIPVPRGTVIRHKDAPPDQPPLAELIAPGARALLAVGGRGGRGNASFKTGSNNAPTLAETGEAGEQFWVDVELKLVADVGIIGVPNAGKSTLLSVLTRAKPKIANYQFTTLVPNLGVCEMDYRSIVLADVPGLLEGAHAGLGLGHEFLRHCQRARILVHIIDGSRPDPLGDYHAICTELALFDPCLASKPQVIAYNKMDLPDSADYWQDIQSDLIAHGITPQNIVAVSAATGSGMKELVRRLYAVLDTLPTQEQAEATSSALNRTAPPSTLANARIDDFTIVPDQGKQTFTVYGKALQRFVQMTDWSYFESLLRVQKVLEAAGVNKELKALGVSEGDTVIIGEIELVWADDQSEGAIYGRFVDDRKARGVATRGSARWPHPT